MISGARGRGGRGGTTRTSAEEIILNPSLARFHRRRGGLGGSARVSPCLSTKGFRGLWAFLWRTERIPSDVGPAGVTPGPRRPWTSLRLSDRGAALVAAVGGSAARLRGVMAFSYVEERKPQDRPGVTRAIQRITVTGSLTPCTGSCRGLSVCPDLNQTMRGIRDG